MNWLIRLMSRVFYMPADIDYVAREMTSYTVMQFYGAVIRKHYFQNNNNRFVGEGSYWSFNEDGDIVIDRRATWSIVNLQVPNSTLFNGMRVDFNVHWDNRIHKVTMMVDAAENITMAFN